MARRWDILKGSMAAAGMALLILDSKTALSGARDGIELCIRTVIPSLFPFFLLSILLTGTVMGIGKRILSPICRVFRIPDGTGPVLLTGLLGGYPVGAQCISQAFEKGQIKPRQARRMLAFCSNCGPAFLFGICGNVFEENWAPWALWAVILISAWITALLIPADKIDSADITAGERMSAQRALNKTLRVMGSVCGWVVIFRVIIQFLQRWFLWLLPEEVQVSVCGLLELSNGCVELGRIESSSLRFMLCAGLLSFGGLCVTMQTYGVLSPKLDARLYFPGKVLQCCISLILSSIICGGEGWQYLWIPCLIGVFSLWFLRKSENNSSIRAAVGV